VTSKISWYDITPETTYINRRTFLKSAAASSLVLPSLVSANQESSLQYLLAKESAIKGAFSDEVLTPYEHVTSYNNFYEFGAGKSDPVKNSHRLKIDPWRVRVEGLVKSSADYHLDDLIKNISLEERIYRLRCVEAWSMVIPWVGVPLSSVLNKIGVQESAKYVRFETLYRPSEMPGQKSLFSGIEYPYEEGLRMDEAMHPLTILAVGLYGKNLLGQNGAPLRLVVPWKYGFKSIKSIVKIELTENEPATTWSKSAPREYGFYANVNPKVSHPRWSQTKERRLPSGIFGANILETQMFNGYADQVASLYSDMNLRVKY
jgi:sulfoxide reductase catalytic subunit YedY